MPEDPDEALLGYKGADFLEAPAAVPVRPFIPAEEGPPPPRMLTEEDAQAYEDFLKEQEREANGHG